MKLKFEFKSNFIKTILIFLATGFVLSGVLNFFTGVGETNILKIDSKKISVNNFVRFFNEKKNQYINSDLSEEDNNFINSKSFIFDSLREFIDNSLFENEINKLSFKQSKEAVYFDIVNDNTFKGENGKFNKRKWTNLLKQNKIDENVYINYISNYNTQNNFLDLISNKNLINDSMFQTILNKENTYIVANIVVIYPNDDLKYKKTNLTENDLKE